MIRILLDDQSDYNKTALSANLIAKTITSTEIVDEDEMVLRFSDGSYVNIAAVRERHAGDNVRLSIWSYP